MGTSAEKPFFERPLLASKVVPSDASCLPRHSLCCARFIALALSPCSCSFNHSLQVRCDFLNLFLPLSIPYVDHIKPPSHVQYKPSGWLREGQYWTAGTKLPPTSGIFVLRSTTSGRYSDYAREDRAPVETDPSARALVGTCPGHLTFPCLGVG